MKVLMSTPAIPYHTGGGVAESTWAVLSELRRRGHQVLALTKYAEFNPKLVLPLQEAGAEHAVAPDADAQKRIVEAWQPDAMFCLSVSNLVPQNVLPQVPRMCVVGDLDHQVPLYRRQYYHRSIPLNYAEIANLHQQAIGIKEYNFPRLKECRVVVASCCHHSLWLAQQGVPNQYIPAAGSGPPGKGWVRSLDSYPQNPIPRISMAGHLQGIATMSGLYFLCEDVMPWLLSDEGLQCDIRIAGAERLYQDLATRLMPYLGPSGPVTLLGYVEDIQAESMAAEICLVTTPIDLGVRTRIIDGLALGCCLVLHKASLPGFADGELVAGENCLVGATGREIVDALKQATGDPALRMRLGQQARRTYEEHHLDSAVRTVDLILAMMAKAPTRHPPVAAATPAAPTMKPGKDQVSRPGAKPESDPGRPVLDLAPAFHGDPVLLAVIDELVRGQDLRLFVETGTEVGSGVLHMAKTYLQLRCHTCEAHRPTYKQALENLKAVRDRVSVFAGKSGDFFERFRNMMPDILEEPALFWLDAHSHGFGAPLAEEVDFVTHNWIGGYILMDDFQVPDHPDFGYDVYQTGPLDWEFIHGSLALERVHQVWWPGYEAAPYPSGRGWSLLTFGSAALWGPPPELAGKLWQSPELLTRTQQAVAP